MVVSPILDNKDPEATSVFEPAALLREARRQKGLLPAEIPELCILDPDGDLVRSLRKSGRAKRSETWPCYHTDLYEFELAGETTGIIGCAVGAPFAVLVAEELFASGCRVLFSLTSAGQIKPVGDPPYFGVIDRSIRDEGTSYHYAIPETFAEADTQIIQAAARALGDVSLPVHIGATWTTDAPFRETATAIEAARANGALAVEMEAAALYTFARQRKKTILCLAHVTNTMGLSNQDFEKGEADGTADALMILEALARVFRPIRQ